MLWCPTEHLPGVAVLFPGARFESGLTGATGGSQDAAVGDSGGPAIDEDALVATALRGHLDTMGPATATQLAAATALRETTVAIGLARLQQEGFALAGEFEPEVAGEQWCSRRLLVRIHGYTQKRLRREIEPVTAQDLMRFLLRWQHVTPGTRRQGRSGLVAVIEQLQGCELPAGTWESSVLPARIEHYRPAWLDELCMAGEVAWGRLRVRDSAGEGVANTTTTSRATPITLVLRADLPWLLQSARGDAVPAEPSAGASCDIIEALRSYGAMFLPELAAAARRLPAEVESALCDGVARGILTADGFAAVRSLLAGRQLASSRSFPIRRGLRRGASGWGGRPGGVGGSGGSGSGGSGGS
ncbi:MAG: Lhr family ATP-dependent helicase, partial [Acidimicrobiales bacterium]